MYKLVAIDCDGTLLTDNKELTAITIETIKKASNKVKIVITTARAFYRVEEYLKKMDLLKDEQFTICFNGGSIIENQSKQEIKSCTFNAEDVKELIELSKDFKTQILLYGFDSLIVENIPEKLRNNKKTNFKTMKLEELEADQYSIYKIVFLNDPKKITEMRKIMPEEIKSKYEVTSSVPEYIEFVPKGITKDKALEILCNKLNIERHEVIAIGDAENDINMLKFAGTGIAMGNAEDFIKNIADDVTDSNNNNGVAKAIKKYIKI